jgi:mRNA interferase RelE/StbE
MYEVIFTKRANRDVKKMDADVQKQVIAATEALEKNPRPHTSKPMKGAYKGYWRERTGNYRIIYEIQDEKLVVLVVRIGHRKNIYR